MIPVAPVPQAAGSALAALDSVMEQAGAKGTKGFAIIRPPGHHATRDAPMGFCLFNNVAIAARYCQERHKLKKVCIDGASASRSPVNIQLSSVCTCSSCHPDVQAGCNRL